MDTPLFEQPEATLELVALKDIEPWSTSGARSATAKSIEALGLRGVVTLEKLAAGHAHRFQVIDGSRRLGKALKQGLEYVRAEVLPEGTSRAEAAALRVVLNMARSANPLQEAGAVQELHDAYLTEGVAEDEIIGGIAKALGISSRRISQRLGLLTLEPSLREGVETGRVAPGVAGKIANLSPALQTQLARDLETKGKLTAADVKAVRRVNQEATLAALPESLFAPLETPLERARAALKGFLAEGVEASGLVLLLEELELERQVV